MALEVYWYDFICFGLVSIAFFAALWVIWRKEGTWRRTLNGRGDTIYDSLLLSRPDRKPDYAKALSKGHLTTSQLWTSCWNAVHPGWLLAVRFISLIVLSGFLAWDVVDWGPSIFVYYTEWTFSLVIIYFALGTIVSAYGCWLSSKEHPGKNGARAERGRPDLEDSSAISSKIYREKQMNGAIKLPGHYDEGEVESINGAGFWGYLFQITYQTCGGAVVITDIVFWSVILPFLSNAHLGLNLLMGCMHCLNAVFLLLDTSLNNLPFPWFRMAYFVLWSCIYVVFQWVIHACGFSWWPYPFLELDSQWAPLWYLCMALVHIPCYGFYALIIKAKYSILPRLFPDAFVTSS